MIRSNMGLSISVYVSLVCKFCSVRVLTWKCSNVFNSGDHFSMWSTFIVFPIMSYVCCVSSMCFAKLELGLLVFYCLDMFLKACSENLCLFAQSILMSSYYILVGKCHVHQKVSAKCFFFILDDFLSCLWFWKIFSTFIIHDLQSLL
jgi:hypothetical protein